MANAAPRARSGAGGRPRRPSLGGGIPAQERELGAQGRQTVRRLLEAGLAEFDERGFQAVRVDDVVRRAKTSHGTFYLYFANKEDLFKTLLRDALHDMAIITGEFPVVTRNEAGRTALRDWIRRFCDTYAAHAAVIRSLSQAELVSEDVWGDGLQLLFRLAEAITQGMTASSRAAGGEPGGRRAARARRAHRRGLPDDARARQLPAQRRGPAAQGRNGRQAQRDHLRRLQLPVAAGCGTGRAGRPSASPGPAARRWPPAQAWPPGRHAPGTPSRPARPRPRARRSSPRRAAGRRGPGSRR